jgi:osmotically-inducible protein OsmY
MKTASFIKLLAGSLALIFSLNACMFLAGAGAGATGTVLVTDKRSLKEINQDASISYQVEKKLYTKEAQTYQADISAYTFNRNVLLVGQAQTQEQRQYAEDVAKNESGVTRVYNEITISPSITFISKTNDKWLTTRIYGEFIARKDLSASSIKIVTVDAVVYLMGNVRRTEGQLAVDIAKHVAGVQRVVTLFNYTD